MSVINIDTEKTLKSFEKKYSVSKNTGCWIWQAALDRGGYGSFSVALIDGTYKTVRAHRFSYELLYGPIPEGDEIRHSCENALCVNPQHLISGTSNQNIQDRKRKIGRAKEQFEEDLTWLVTNTGIITKTKAFRFALRLLRNTVTTEELRRYADVGRSL